MRIRKGSIIFLILVISVALLFFLSQESFVKDYNTKELAMSSLLDGKNSVLETILVGDDREVIVFYDKDNEAIFIVTIRALENRTKFIVENQTNAWKIGGKPSPMISGLYDVGDESITFYAWKGSDKIVRLVNDNKLINENKNKIKEYEEDVYLLFLLDR
ncbi:hypothetical protein SAMN05446037_10555 [Anaerovirgula multivorans]|uniref:Uncharacterized protein n=1 Tax=Anaerovirgula multivorans TaxID=312168 RepID=A0A239KV63_9FIRM|nr:hypothetical protein [Anaerovirgula multivorans]SNT21910.1 hypothetical protein SAMN05446037_10555 [Anaerovirgula multivorans]